MAVTSSGSTLIYLGANAHKELVHQLLEINPEIRFIESAVYPEHPQPLYEDKLSSDSVIIFDSGLVSKPDKIHPKAIKFTPVNGYNKRKVIESVMSDKHLSLLWSRSSRKTRWFNHSEVKRYEVTYSLIKSALETCDRTKLKKVIFSYQPHELPMYIFQKVCVALGIKTFTMSDSPFIWRMFMEVEIGDGLEPTYMPVKTADTQNKNESVARLISEKKSDYSVAKPFFEKTTVAGGLVKRFTHELKENGWNPCNIILGKTTLANYRKLTTARREFKGVKYICVFLQYQPELTTLPNGGLFVHQLFVIQMLYSAVTPLGISLVVREHPSTFRHSFNPKWRPRDFYSSIMNIGPNIYFDEINKEPYSLLKNSIAVASITGTVLLESLLLGRPAIAFGKIFLKGYTATAFVDKFSDEVELREEIAKAVAESPDVISSEFESYLHAVYPSTFGPSKYVGNTAMTLDKLREARYTALRQAVQLIAGENTSKKATI